MRGGMGRDTQRAKEIADAPRRLPPMTDRRGVAVPDHAQRGLDGSVDSSPPLLTFPLLL